MSALRAFVAELRERRLLPLVIVLVVGIVAVPVVLAKSPSPSASAVPPSGVPVSASPASPAVSLASSPPPTTPHGFGRDPFTQPFGGTPAHPATSSVKATSSLPATPVTPASTGGSGLGPTPSPTTTTPTTTPTGGGTPTTTPSNDPVDQPSSQASSGLTATESYYVTLSITNSGGGLNTMSPLMRLSVLPSQRHPLLVELGVLAGGRRVLFAVQPGAVVRGPGRCTPGPINCQILSLARGQTETLSSTDGSVSHVLLAVTGLTVARHPSVAAARRARRSASAAGRRLMSASTLGALALFRYDPRRGAVVDLRNVGVGGR